MTDKNRINLCKQCEKREFNPKVGLLCSLTHEKPSFDGECINLKNDTKKLKSHNVSKLKPKNWKVPLISESPLEIGKYGNKKIIKADENQLIIKHGGVWESLFWGIILLVLYLIAAIKFYEVIEYPYYLIFLGLFSIILLMAISKLATALYGMKKTWVFNRKNQTVSVPGVYNVKHYTLAFDELSVSIFRGNYGTKETVMHVPAKGLLKWSRFNYVTFPDLYDRVDSDDKNWSFYTWYMDQNRPLPPGKMFDHCRENEFNIRRQKGFPLPMYYSLVHTPEHTPQFKEERDKVWKDETFCPDINKYGNCKITSKEIKLPKDTKVYSSEFNPESWEMKEIKDPANFMYAPKVSCVRYVFNDNKVVYSRCRSNKVMVPPDNTCYSSEYFRDKYWF